MEIENKGIVKNGFFSVIQLLISTGCYVIIYYLILSKLGKAQLGIWSIMSSVPAALTVFGSGVSGCLLRYIPVYAARKDSRQLNQIIFSGTLFNVLIACIAITAGYYFSQPLLKFLFSTSVVPQSYTVVFNATLVIFFLNFVSSVFLFTLDGLQLIYKRNIIVMISSLCFCVSAALLINSYGLEGLLYAQIIQSLLLLLMALYLLGKARIFKIRYFQIQKTHFRLFLGYGQNFQYISLAIMLFEPLTKYFLNKYFNLSIVGLYDIVNRVITQVRSVIVSAIMVIVPVVSRLSEENLLDVNQLYKKAVRGGTLLSMLSYSSLLIIAVPILTRLDKKDLNLYLIFLVALSGAYILSIISSSAYGIFMGLGKLKPIIVSHLLSTGINMCLFLIIKYNPVPAMMILPPSIAIALSSIYITYQFRKEFILDRISISREDIGLYAVSTIAVIASLVFYIYSLPPVFIYVLVVLYVIAITYLMLTNTFLLSISESLIPFRRNRKYGT